LRQHAVREAGRPHGSSPCSQPSKRLGARSRSCRAFFGRLDGVFISGSGLSVCVVKSAHSASRWAACCGADNRPYHLATALEATSKPRLTSGGDDPLGVPGLEVVDGRGGDRCAIDGHQGGASRSAASGGGTDPSPPRGLEFPLVRLFCDGMAAIDGPNQPWHVLDGLGPSLDDRWLIVHCAFG
jgi:hypothetical protein